MNTLSLLELILDGEEHRPTPLETGNQLLFEIDLVPEFPSESSCFQLKFFTATKDWYTLFWLDDFGQLLDRHERKSKKGFNQFELAPTEIPAEATQVQLIHPDGIQATPLPGRNTHPISIF